MKRNEFECNVLQFQVLIMNNVRYIVMKIPFNFSNNFNIEQSTKLKTIGKRLGFNAFTPIHKQIL